MGPPMYIAPVWLSNGVSCHVFVFLFSVSPTASSFFARPICFCGPIKPPRPHRADQEFSRTRKRSAFLIEQYTWKAIWLDMTACLDAAMHQQLPTVESRQDAESQALGRRSAGASARQRRRCCLAQRSAQKECGRRAGRNNQGPT